MRHIFPRWTIVLAFSSIALGYSGKGNWVPYPSHPEIEAITTQLKSADPAAIDKAIHQIHTWVNGQEVPWEMWHDWMPLLMQDSKNQEAADLALDAALTRPEQDYIEPLMQARVQALLNLNKPAEALQAAKGYYNVCRFATTPQAIELVGQCLAKCHPEDGEIVRRFRAEQAAASNAGSSAAMQGSTVPVLQSIQIDVQPFDEAVKAWSSSNTFSDQVWRGNILLIAGRGEEAEKLFRELYQMANSQDDLKLAAEGLVRALRAEDGNVGRANAWLVSLQQLENPSANAPK